MKKLALLLALVAVSMLGNTETAGARLGITHSVSATGYCSGQRTSLGTRARWGVVAVLPGNQAFGRRLYVIHGIYNPIRRHRYWWFRAEDHIGSGSVFDIFIPWGGEPDCAWGRKRIAYRILF